MINVNKEKILALSWNGNLNFKSARKKENLKI